MEGLKTCVYQAFLIDEVMGGVFVVCQVDCSLRFFVLFG